ncbi:MAG TPA: hypothetical protein VFI58_03180 [Xanthobacteraceae bacterium]|nr:hypothetical protein [Xanthobacteraceae bacterium]
MANIADLSVTVTDGKTSVVPGVNYVVLVGSQPNFPFNNDYTVTVSNDGPDTVTQFNLNIVPAAGFTWIGTFFGNAGSQSPQNGNLNTWLWSGLSLASGQSAFTTFIYNMDPNATGPLALTFTVSPPAGTTDPTPTNNSFTDSDTVTPQADLSVTIDDGKTIVTPGTSTTYTITVKNNGPSPVTSLTLTDTIPAALLNASFGTPSAGSYDSVTGLWSGLSLASGQSVSITLTGTVDPNLIGSLTNTVTVAPPSGTTDANSANNSASDTDTTPQADLSVAVSDGKTSVVPGTSNTYTITVTNNGPSTVSSLTLTDTIPAGLLNTSFGTPSLGTYDSATGVWSGLSLASGQNVTITLTGTIDPNWIGSLSNTVTVSAPSGTTDTNAANNSATDTDTPTPVADLAVVVTGVGTVPGASTTYTITVTNNGPSTAVGAQVTDVLAALTNVVWTATASVGSSVAAPTGTGNIADLVTLLPGGTVTFTAVGQIDPSLTGTLANTATVAAPAGTTDPNATNDSSTFSTALTPQADLAVSIDDGTTSVVPGTSTTYTITVTNNGPTTVTSLTLTDSIPAALLNPNFAPSAGTYDTNTRVWSGLNLTSGQSATMTLAGTISANATGSLSNTVTVTAPSGTTDANPSNNSATDTDTLALPADLAVAITDAATTLVPGAVDTYTITVTNNGANTVSSFTLIDTIPDALLNASFGSPSAGSYNAGSGLWSGLNLASGQSVSITRSGTIGITTGTLSNTVTVSLPAGLGDPNPANNTATDTDTLVLFSSPYPPAPAAASANMVLRRTDGLYAIYNLGNNATLATHPLAQVGSEWQFAGVGRFQAGDTADMLLRNASTGGFQVYDISNNNITNTAFLGNVGLDWQVMGFGNFSSRGETDMILRNSGNGGVEVYDITNNKITGAAFMGTVGLDWQFSGVGNFSGRGESDLLLRNSNTGGLEVYDIANNQITNAAFIGAVGLDWQFSGVGNFSGVAGETNLLLRNVNTGGLQVYDITNNQLTGSAFLGTVGLDWQFAGVAPVRGAGTSDLVLRNVTTGVFEAYNIANNQIVGAASLGKVGLEWQVGGFAADPAPASGNLGSTAQLVQTMAALGGAGGAADGFNVAALNADASQTFLTQPHA